MGLSWDLHVQTLSFLQVRSTELNRSHRSACTAANGDSKHGLASTCTELRHNTARLPRVSAHEAESHRSLPWDPALCLQARPASGMPPQSGGASKRLCSVLLRPPSAPPLSLREKHEAATQDTGARARHVAGPPTLQSPADATERVALTRWGCRCPVTKGLPVASATSLLSC